ncbi:MAG: FmdB family zinc ribbon protein [Candidatus Omnitrophota bacterium]
MPTYDYRCLKCGKVFEAFQKITDNPLDKCIYCKGEVERLISSGSGIIFKGSGFYETDYKQKNRKPTSDNDKQCKSCSDNKCDLKKDK